MRFRRHKIAGAAALAIGLTGTLPASAQVAVVDFRAIAQAIEQVRQLQSQLTQLQQTYAAIAHLPRNELNRLARQFDTSQFRNPLGTSSASIGGMLDGSGSLAAGAQGYLDRNRVYAPPGQDFQATQMGRNANSIANAQAIAAQLYQSAASHIQTLQGLEGELASAPDAKAIADLQARLTMEQASFQGQQLQAQSLAMWQAAQERNQDQRNDEVRRKQVDNLIEQAKAHGG
ncbi:type IV secretion system protein [Agrobacterium rosae]|uniref:P-type DNA transfer protein VirB5 n=1 Tax=Agrobacterium rosae TaxID=1972867 RepID=A0A1R3U354_9HYPH|nr:type IV secretion system protein [Agrobacterium rosae]SCX35832.1 P-type DNA transfer protein VirB5 [Agrobacterium rosae]